MRHFWNGANAPGRVLTWADRLELWAFAALWVFVFLLPCDKIFSLPLVGREGRAAGVVAAGLAVLSIVAGIRVRAPAAAHALMAVWVAWLGASWLWSSSPEDTVVRSGHYGQLLALVWLVWQLCADQARRLNLFRSGSLLSAAGTVLNSLVGQTAVSPLGDLLEGRYGAWDIGRTPWWLFATLLVWKREAHSPSA